MATHHEIVGEEWVERSTELADWAIERLVNRWDVWGQYSVLSPAEQRQHGRSYKAMTLPQKTMRGNDMVTHDKLARHFSSRHFRKPQIIGLHAKSKDQTSRWLGIDIDCHDTEASASEDHARRNEVAAIGLWSRLQGDGYDPLVFDSSGLGGFHVWVLFDEPAPTVDVHLFARSLVEDWEAMGLDEEPEVFPKKPNPDRLGAWFRLPGLHHTHEHYSRVYSGDDWLADPWLSGHAAIDAMIGALPGPPPPTADAATLDRLLGARRTVAPKTPGAPAERRFERSGRARICLDLDGVLAHRHPSGALDEIGPPIDGAVDFTRRLAESCEIVVLTSRLSAAGTRRTAEGRKLAARIEEWLDEHGFAWDELCTDAAKPAAHAYVDDRAVACRPEDVGLVAFTEAEAAVSRLIGES